LLNSQIMALSFFGNTLWAYAGFLGVLVGGFLLLWVIRRFVVRRIKQWTDKTENTLDDLVVDALEKVVGPLLAYFVFVVSLRSLNLPASFHHVVAKTTPLLLVFFAVRFLDHGLWFLVSGLTRKSQGDAHSQQQIRALKPIVTVFLWAGGVIFLLDNWGFKISSLVAGLGIGGVAVALAAQALLGDLLSYFSIVFDRPFEIGDFIVVGEKRGTVEYVGIKTTRLRSLDGEELVFSNTDLTTSRLQNLKRMELRRVLFRVGVTYDTPVEKLKAVPPLIKTIVEKVEGTRFDRAHFIAMENSSLVFEIVYFVLNNDFNVYADAQQRINLEIMETFQKEKISFAFPTQTVYVHRGDQGKICNLEASKEVSLKV